MATPHSQIARRAGFAAALAAGAVLLALAFPPVGIPWLAMAGFGVFFLCLFRTRHPFFTGLFFHAVFSLCLTVYLLPTLSGHFGLNLFMALFFFGVFAGVLPAIYFAAASVLIRWEGTRGRKAGFARAFFSLAFGAALVALAEALRSHVSLEGGYGLMGSAFSASPLVLSIAPFTGGAGITFGAALVGAGLAAGVDGVLRKQAFIGIGLFAATVLLFLGLILLGRALGPGPSPPVSASLEVALVHPAIGQEKRWDPAFHEENLETYQAMTRSAFLRRRTGAARLIVWPETALTRSVVNDSATRQEVANLAIIENVWILTGSIAWDEERGERRFFNSAALFSPAGEITARYDKVRLLPFAEKHVGWLAIGGSDHPWYSAGKSARPLALDAGGGRTIDLGVSICFEVGEASLMGEMAAGPGPTVLVNLSNDAWFGEGAESDQELATLSLRCAELGVPGIRATGYGVAALVAADGSVIEKTGILEKSVLAGTLSPRPGGATFHARHPAWFLWMLILFALAWGAGTIAYDRKRKGRPGSGA